MSNTKEVRRYAVKTVVFAIQCVAMLVVADLSKDEPWFSVLATAWAFVCLLPVIWNALFLVWAVNGYCVHEEVFQKQPTETPTDADDNS